MEKSCPFALLLYLLIFAGCQGCTHSTHLIGYKQSEKAISIELDRFIICAQYTILEEVPISIKVSEIKKRLSSKWIFGRTISIPLINEPSKGEYSIIIFANGNYVELVRQSSNWLYQTFGFKRSGGYTILGRRSIATNRGTITQAGTLSLVGRPKNISLKPINVSDFKEINLAASLLMTLWEHPINQGPTSLSYKEFLQHPFEEKIRRLCNGEFAVMCTGFRDLFIHAAIAIPDLKVRIVEAVNYEPQIVDLISYGHSTSEIWVERLNKWVLFDPWLGIIVMDNGVPVGSEELNKIENVERISVFPIIDFIQRIHQKRSGEIVVSIFYPKDVRVSEFSCQKFGCSPGYIEFFKHIKYRKVVFVER